jgi:hypothetical protein
MSNTPYRRRLFAAVVLVALANAASADDSEGGTLQFSKRCLVVQNHEGCAIADLNRDGKPDILAGPWWFAGPDFDRRPLRPAQESADYLSSNGDHVYDVDGDMPSTAGTNAMVYENRRPSTCGRLITNYTMTAASTTRRPIRTKRRIWRPTAYPHRCERSTICCVRRWISTCVAPGKPTRSSRPSGSSTRLPSQSRSGKQPTVSANPVANGNRAPPAACPLTPDGT